MIANRRWPLAPLVIDYVAQALEVDCAEACSFLKAGLVEGDIKSRGPLPGVDLLSTPIPADYWQWVGIDYEGRAIGVAGVVALPWFEICAKDALMMLSGCRGAAEAQTKPALSERVDHPPSPDLPLSLATDRSSASLQAFPAKGDRKGARTTDAASPEIDPAAAVIRPNKIGRPNERRIAVEAKMREELAEGRLTVADLAALKKKQLPARFGAGETTCMDARRAILFPTNSDQPIPTNNK